AIEDYNQAIRINPNFAEAYYNRGIARASSGDDRLAIEDLQKAANLFQEQGSIAKYQAVIKKIKQIRGRLAITESKTFAA
ncbi:tetratricopeptide repeat protein, partial [Nostoc sp.]